MSQILRFLTFLHSSSGFYSDFVLSRQLLRVISLISAASSLNNNNYNLFNSEICARCWLNGLNVPFDLIL